MASLHPGASRGLWMTGAELTYGESSKPMTNMPCDIVSENDILSELGGKA